MDTSFEATVSYWIHFTGIWIEIFGVLIIVLGILWSTCLLVYRLEQPRRYEQYRTNIGRSLLLGLEFLVAAEIVKTIAIDLSFESLGLLAGLIAVRTFLSWTLLLDIDRCWPWQNKGAVENSSNSEATGRDDR